MQITVGHYQKFFQQKGNFFYKNLVISLWGICVNYKEGHLGNKMTRNEKRSSMVTGKVFWFPPLRRIVIIILKNNNRFNITSIVISDYRIISMM